MAPYIAEVRTPEDNLVMEPPTMPTAHKTMSANGNERQRMMTSNPSLQVTADHKVKMVEAPIEEPGLGEVLVHIKSTGICG